MTSALMRALNERVMAYGSHHTLRCLALARKAIPSSSDQVRLLLHCYLKDCIPIQAANPRYSAGTACPQQEFPLCTHCLTDVLDLLNAETLEQAPTAGSYTS